MPVLPFGEWLPDQPDFGNAGSATIKNAVPLTGQSYGPMPTPQVYSGALTARCQGSYSYQDDGGSVHIFAGDQTKLYQLTAGSAPAFSDVSRTVGGAYATASPIDPQIATAPSWSMTSFGKRIVATNGVDDQQTFLVGTDSNFSKLSAGAPKAKFVTTIKDFLLVGNTVDATFGTNIRRLWWPAIGDPTNWPVPATNAAIQVQSDYQDLEQSDLGQLTGLLGGHLNAADGAAWCERGIYRVQYVGSGAGIFAFAVAEGAAGTQSPLSIVPSRLNGGAAVACYLSPDGFKAFDGMSSVPIGAQKIDQTFFDDLDPLYVSMVQGGAIPKSQLAYWLYNSSTGSGAGLYDRMLLFNTLIGRWALCDLAATPLEWGTRALAPGYTLDQLDAFGTLDTLPAALDSGFWAGGTTILGVFDSNHKLNFLNGAPMPPVLETSEAQLVPGRRSKILSARPLVDFGKFGASGPGTAVLSSSGTQAATSSVQIGVRDRLSDQVSWQSPVAMNAIGDCPQHVTGRYVRARLTIPAGDQFTHAQGVELDVRREGRR